MACKLYHGTSLDPLILYPLMRPLLVGFQGVSKTKVQIGHFRIQF